MIIWQRNQSKVRYRTFQLRSRRASRPPTATGATDACFSAGFATADFPLVLILFDVSFLFSLRDFCSARSKAVFAHYFEKRLVIIAPKMNITHSGWESFIVSTSIGIIIYSPDQRKDTHENGRTRTKTILFRSEKRSIFVARKQFRCEGQARRPVV